ncbi:52K [Equine adenovirus 2]|uniref:52K n=1 Tax=Equine adenovirus B serotype 2 TaxID=67603 RepID=A0A0K1DBT9_ADEE2|nr:52K [Equine adenovirus 2]AKT26025.1 52K [Equine adenovirus 2]
MHPVLRQMKPTPQKTVHPTAAATTATAAPEPEEEGEGLARLTHDPETHPRAVLKKDASEAYVPKRNLIREEDGEYAETVRDLRLRAGSHMRLDSQRVLTDHDFETEPAAPTSVSPARAHLEAANLLTTYQQTVKEEKNFQQSFNNHVRTLVARQEVTVGLMHLWDFVEALTENPSSRSLTSQLFLILQHSRDDGVFRESLLHIGDPDGRWLLDLINVLHTIVVQERNLKLAEKVAAINYSVLTLAKFYARKIYHNYFVPMDKEVKIATFYMRMVLKVLCLSDDLGVYRNEKMQRVVAESRKREIGDASLMSMLRRALTDASSSNVTDLPEAVSETYARGRAEEDEDSDGEDEFY